MRVRTGLGPGQPRSLRTMKPISQSVLDSILDDSDSKDELYANGHSLKNGHSNGDSGILVNGVMVGVNGEYGEYVLCALPSPTT